MNINTQFDKLPQNYLFTEIGEKIREYENTPHKNRLIRMDIGDVTRPLPKSVSEAMAVAASEMSKEKTFHGYSGELGYPFMRKAIASHYKRLGVSLDENEISISDGAKTDLSLIGSLFSKDATVLVPTPAYPVYRDTNIIDGRNVIFLPCRAENGYEPEIIRNTYADVIYLCSPNNPTGVAYSRKTLENWVSYANEHNSLIIFDSAYEAYAQKDKVKSIFEIKDADRCSVEIGSFSKSAGFTGIRLGWTVVPEKTKLLSLWCRNKAVRSNGVSYITQRGGEAALTPNGIFETEQNIAYYKNNAAVFANMLSSLGIKYSGAADSPYIWMKIPEKMSSEMFFCRLLENVGVSCTPGSGFVSDGNGMVRFSSFAKNEDILEASERVKHFLQYNKV